MNAAMPPVFCASATTCRAIVVLPEDSGPKISVTRPRGNPPTPRAASSEIDPVEITETGTMASFAAEPQNRPFAKLLFDLSERLLEGARALTFIH